MPVRAAADVVAGKNQVSAKKHTIVFTPSGKRGTFDDGVSILDAAREIGVDIDSVCGARGICGRCQVTVGEGAFAKHKITSSVENLIPLTDPEKRFDEKKGLKAGRRLGCHALISGDLVIDVPAESQVHKQVVRKRAEVHDITIDPEIRLYVVVVEAPDMHTPSGDLRRLQDALAGQWNLKDITIPLRVLVPMQTAMRDAKGELTVAIYKDARIVAVWPGYKDRAFGLAYDVGSTTIAAHLCDLATGEVVAASGLMNPQIRFGEDLMSRVSYVMMNPGGEKELTEVVQGALNDLARDVAREAGIETTDILSAVIVGNPIMHHLALGLDPTPLGVAPFALAVDQALDIATEDINLEISSGADAYILPCIAGHVGADTAGVILSEAPHRSDDMTLIVDVGTNAEIVLGNRDRLLACSSPTGPAFEGAQISSGQRAAPGAIERVRIDPVTLEPRYRIIGSDTWSDEAGFEDVAKSTGVTGICGSGIIEAVAEMFLAGILTADGVIDGSKAETSERISADGRTFSYLLRAGEPEVRITQNDVRAIQLAKGALYAGARLLMDRLSIETPDRIVLAGAFGSHIDVKYAMVLGLIPDCNLERVQSAGNAAGTGARIALLNLAARKEIEDVVRWVEKVETAVEPAFQQHFVEAMAFPHKTHPYSNLKKVVEIPEPTETSPSNTDEPRRRRRRSQARSAS